MSYYKKYIKYKNKYISLKNQIGGINNKEYKIKYCYTSLNKENNKINDLFFYHLIYLSNIDIIITNKNKQNKIKEIKENQEYMNSIDCDYNYNKDFINKIYNKYIKKNNKPIIESINKPIIESINKPIIESINKPKFGTRIIKIINKLLLNDKNKLYLDIKINNQYWLNKNEIKSINKIKLHDKLLNASNNVLNNLNKLKINKELKINKLKTTEQDQISNIINNILYEFKKKNIYIINVILK